MLAQQHSVSAPNSKDIQAWARQQTFDAKHMDCMTAVILKILDGKCQMNTQIQGLFIDIYRVMEKDKSELFDLAIHPFILKVLDEADALSLRHVHELRLFAESTIEKPVMKAFKQSYSFLIKA